MAVTLFVRKGQQESGDAQAFLAANGYRADRVQDVDAAPPAAPELAALRTALGGDLWLAVDTRHPSYGDLLPRGAEDVDDDALAALLQAHPELLRTPILVTPKGALAGFRERKWRDFLDIGKGRG